jgi:hypothetical protein
MASLVVEPAERGDFDEAMYVDRQAIGACLWSAFLTV